MTIDEIREEASRRLILGSKMMLVLEHQSKGYRIRLFGNRGPYGDIACVNEQGETVAWFEPKAVLKALKLVK